MRKAIIREYAEMMIGAEAWMRRGYGADGDWYHPDVVIKLDKVATVVASCCHGDEVDRALECAGPAISRDGWIALLRGKRLLTGERYGLPKKNLSLRDIDKLVGRFREPREPHKLDTLVDNRV